MLVMEDDLGGASASYREAIRLSPNDAGLHSALAFTRTLEGDLEGAITSLREMNPICGSKFFVTMDSVNQISVLFVL